MSNHDEDLQHNLEKGSRLPTGSPEENDARIYLALFKTLQNTPEPSIPYNFADRVVARVVSNTKKKSARDLVWLTVGIFMLIVTTIVAVVFSGFKIDVSVFKGISGIAGIALFAIVFSFMLGILDRKLLPREGI